MMSIYNEVSGKCSQEVTRAYSTSFYGAIQLLHKDLRQPIHNIYGFVRLADEIVDTFHGHNKVVLLKEFIESTWSAVTNKISLNPILQSFQDVVHQYNIPHHLVEAFLNSMQLDLFKTEYNTPGELNDYIYGSAEVVGLMCLCVFCEGDVAQYEKLKVSASRLGAAFQKVNFLRDMRDDKNNLNRTYFPDLVGSEYDGFVRLQIEDDIESDFSESLCGIRMLPVKARNGVYTAYQYYYTLFKKIKQAKAQTIMEQRVRVPDYQKMMIAVKARMYSRLNLI